MLRRFKRSNNGNIAMMFGLLLVPMLIGAGIGFDMMRIGDGRSTLTEATDSGLLAAVRAKTLDGTLTQAQAQDLARKYFDANGGNGANVIVDSFVFVEDLVNKTYELRVTGRIKTTLLGFMGQEYAPINIVSAAKITPPRDLEIALVLDNTYSMTGTKLATLKTAATGLVDTVMKDVDNTTKVAVIPFSQYVNIGLSRRNEQWLDVDDDYSEVRNVCWNTYPDRVDTNCVTTTETCSNTRDGVTTEWSCERTRCDTEWGEPVEVCEDRTYNYTWNGCAGSRNYPFNVQDGGYVARRAIGLLNIWCPREITPLTTNKVAVTAELTAMSVQGYETYIPAGLAWGYRALSEQEPLTEGISYQQMADDGAVKALVLMTDGENTKSAQYPYHNKAQGIDAERILEETCDEMKGDAITVYTIAFEVTDQAVKTLVEDCATSRDHYFDATNAQSLVDAFDAIGKSLTELALTK